MKNIDKDFWKFTITELGLYDVPAVVDYILNETDQGMNRYLYILYNLFLLNFVI